MRAKRSCSSCRLYPGRDKRHLESFRYWGTGSPFEYDMVRYLFTKKREFDSMK